MSPISDTEKPFFIIPARNKKYLFQKITELEFMDVPYLIVCGEKVNHPNVVYHENAGKWDALNFAFSMLPDWVKIVVLNDVDTKIQNFESALSLLTSSVQLVYCKVIVPFGPQVKFYQILNPIRKRFHVAASGELMVMRKVALKKILPIPPCLAEDSFILFKFLEIGYKVKFCTDCYITTERTNSAEEEIFYKNRTTLGIYQALDYSKPPPIIRVFYLILPFLAPLLSMAGKDGVAWATGINRAFRDHLTKKNPRKF